MPQPIMSPLKQRGPKASPTPLPWKILPSSVREEQERTFQIIHYLIMHPSPVRRVSADHMKLITENLFNTIQDAIKHLHL